MKRERESFLQSAMWIHYQTERSMARTACPMLYWLRDRTLAGTAMCSPRSLSVRSTRTIEISLMMQVPPLATRAFTLMEMIIVVSIIAFIAAIVTPAVASLLKSSQLSQAGLMVNDQLAFARQTALAQNRPIEVRFYRCGDPEIPGESVTSAAQGKYRTMQIFRVEEDGSASAVSEAVRLPVTMILDSGAVLSSILNQSARPAGKAAVAPDLPRVGANYVYSFFRFRPNGATDLLDPANPTAPWFVTLHALTDGDGRASQPANFYTIQIDAFNGNLRTFRP